MAPIQQSTLIRLSFNHASMPTEIGKIIHMGRAQHVFKCFAGSGPVTVNTMLSPAWEPSRMHAHTPANGEYCSLVYLGICMWEVKTIPAVCLHCMGHPKNHSNTNCLDLIGDGRVRRERRAYSFFFLWEERRFINYCVSWRLYYRSKAAFCDNSSGIDKPSPCLKQAQIWNVGDDCSLGINFRPHLFLASREYMANCSWDGLYIYKGESEIYLELKITQKHKGMWKLTNCFLKPSNVAGLWIGRPRLYSLNFQIKLNRHYKRFFCVTPSICWIPCSVYTSRGQKQFYLACP